MKERDSDRMAAQRVEELLTQPFANRAIYFREYRGPPPQRTWNRKPIVGPPQRPFAELQMVERLEQDQWIAGWCYRAGKFIASWEPEKREVTFPAPATELLRQIAAQAGTDAGCWDVFAWKDGQPLFTELKRSGSSDVLRESQEHWRATAEALGVSSRAFKKYEWLGGDLNGYALKAMSRTYSDVTEWACYREGRMEYGGRNPDAARSWVEDYQRRTGLDGADLLWVVFRDNSSGVTDWDIKQTKVRTRRR